MENEKLNSRGKRETTKDSMYREKLLEYMEKEYERQDEQNEKITSRVSISVSVATEVIFILPSVISVPSLPSLRGVIGVIALISIGLAVALLFGLLIMWKKFSGPNMRQLYDALYDTNKYAKPETDPQKFYTAYWLEMWEENERFLRKKQQCYNAAMVLLGMFVILEMLVQYI